MLRRVHTALRRTRRLTGDLGQTTAEYALVIMGAAGVATLLVTWAARSHAIARLFDAVIGKVVP